MAIFAKYWESIIKNSGKFPTLPSEITKKLLINEFDGPELNVCYLEPKFSINISINM